MNTRDVQQALVNLGWPITVDGSYGPQTHDAVTDFQRGFAHYDLMIDGAAGPQTWQALSIGTASDHFHFVEFKSKGNGWIKVHRELIRGLETYRAHFASSGLTIVSGYRDPLYNHKVGGATNSQHLYGNASDIPPLVPFTTVIPLQLFSGIGHDRDGRVRHVDVRHVGPNTTGGSPQNPTVWEYAE